MIPDYLLLIHCIIVCFDSNNYTDIKCPHQDSINSGMENPYANADIKAGYYYDVLFI